jgi:hypothetical protein
MSANAFDWQASVVADVHDDVTQTPRSPEPPVSSPAVAVNSPTPKLNPCRVTDVYPEWGALRRTSDTTAASKLKTPRPVPAMLPTVTCKKPNTSKSGTGTQLSDVEETHALVVQALLLPAPPISRPDVAVWSARPKFRPDTVTAATPVSGMFTDTAEPNAASKLKIGLPVPDTAATVTLTLPNTSAKGSERQDSAVTDVQDDVKHTPRSPLPPRSSPAVAVCSPTPKLRPDTVTDA